MIHRRPLTHGAALAWLLAGRRAFAQPVGKVPRVAYISPNEPLANMAGPDPVDGITRAFVHGLRELGWRDGSNVIIERRSAEGRPEGMPALMRELVEQRVDVIVTGGLVMARAARRATDKIPIVAIGPDLVAAGLASSLSRPGGNVTGLPFNAGPALDGKRLELLKRTVPNARRVTVISRAPTAGQLAVGPVTTAAAHTLGLVLSHVAVDRAGDLEPAFVTITRERPDAILVSNSPVNIAERAHIIAFAARARLPAVYSLRVFAESGGLLTYGVHLPEVVRRAAAYVDRILKGAQPGEMPIEQPTRFEFIVNLKTAAAIGLTLPNALLQTADEVIR